MSPPPSLLPPVVVRLCRLAIGLVLLAAALGKMGDPASLAYQIRNFRILSPGAENLPALVLPWIELLAGLSLVFGVRPRSGAWVALGLMTLFTAVVVTALVRRLDIECGCFGTGDASRVGVSKLIENLAFTALAWVASVRVR